MNTNFISRFVPGKQLFSQSLFDNIISHIQMEYYNPQQLQS